MSAMCSTWNSTRSPARQNYCKRIKRIQASASILQHRRGRCCATRYRCIEHSFNLNSKCTRYFDEQIVIIVCDKHHIHIHDPFDVFPGSLGTHRRILWAPTRRHANSWTIDYHLGWYMYISIFCKMFTNQLHSRIYLATKHGNLYAPRCHII